MGASRGSHEEQWFFTSRFMQREIVSSSSQSLDNSRSKHITIEATFVFSRPAGRGRAYTNSTSIFYESTIIGGKIISYQHYLKIV